MTNSDSDKPKRKSGKMADIDKSENYAFNKEARKPKPGKGNADPERVIARLKRDKADEAQPEEVHGGVNQVGNSDMNKGARKRSNKDPERIIALLKRDKADEAQPAEVRQKAGFLLAGIERGEVKLTRCHRR